MVTIACVAIAMTIGAETIVAHVRLRRQTAPTHLRTRLSTQIVRARLVLALGQEVSVTSAL